MNLDDKMKFGKYKTYSIHEIIEDDPTYLEWCLDHIKTFKLSDDAQDLLDDALDRYYQYDDDLTYFYDDHFRKNE